MKIRKLSGEIVTVDDTYIVADGEALHMPLPFMDAMEPSAQKVLAAVDASRLSYEHADFHRA